MLKNLENYRYLNSESEEISNFAKWMKENTNNTKDIVQNIIKWYDENVEHVEIIQI